MGVQMRCFFYLLTLDEEEAWPKQRHGTPQGAGA